MRLWIAEKPDAGRQIAKALGGGHNGNGHIKLSNGDVVTWAIGHLLESYMPQDYNEEYKKWDLDHLPILPERFLRKPEKSKAGQLNTIVRLVKQAREVVIATDAGREGEFIAWSILDHAGWKGPCLRFWTSSLNESHLKKAVHQLIDDAEKKPLYVAARIRSSMDWADGINWSRYYNLRSGNYGDAPLSLGRVQTATLAILVDRDEEIDNFNPSPYYELKATMDVPQGKLELMHAPPEDKRITDAAEAQDIARRTQGVPTNLKVAKKPKTFSPPPPFSLPELQMTASSRWGWSAKKTLDVLQQLYEKGAVTYPRTDSGYLTEEMIDDMPKHLGALRQQPKFSEMAAIDPVIRKKIFDSKKVEDHHGIIPTEEYVDISKLGPEAENLFEVIARRFVAALMPDAQGSTTSISAIIDGVLFKTSGTIISVPGWKAVWDDKPDEEEKNGDEEDTNRVLPPVEDGQATRATKVDVLNKMTRPPPHFTEGTLLKAMMAAGSKNDDKEIRDLLSNGGLGTQATRQDILEKLKKRTFAVLKGKKFLSTPRAREFIKIIREDGNRLADVVATANLERELREIEKDPSSALRIWTRYTQTLVGEISQLKAGPAPRKLTPAPRKGRGGSPAKGKGKRKYAPAKGGPKKKAARG
ncbi:DNA topoisomerase III [Erythrobacter aureus]|uniref:DNA topoisomerase n=1 Tax=Erythrobacter aureus TaxID=2182384 RepID=A0A345YIL9_9SPHN|nr:DNA topoisomerase III [Erythrobacter aureus]AXK43771.1 DNA topoisomerase III [Erythrobacter aureus]